MKAFQGMDLMDQDDLLRGKGCRPLFGAALALLLLVQAQAEPLGPEATATLAHSALPASGRGSTLLRVTEYGRYALTARSAQGTGLQLVDRLAGPGPVQGKAGEQDGRLDLLLDQGEYKLLTHAHGQGTGEVTLAVHGFTELSQPEPPQLMEHRLVTTALDDLQQRSYWLHIEQRRHVILEAAGRNLADLRLWKDGSWLADVEPQISVVHPRVGRPLTRCQIDASLEPGLYRLTAYGGPPQPWTEDPEQHPLYLRHGIPSLAAAARQRFELSPFGADRYLVPGEANYFRLSLPEARPARIVVGEYREGGVFSESGAQVAIDKKTVPPVAELETGGRSNAMRLVTIEGQAGEPYVLQHFERRQTYQFRGAGRYWISTLHAGSAADSIDATSILTRRHRGNRPELFDARLVTLDAEGVFKRRFNLLEPVTLFLEVPSQGKFRVSGEGEGVRARYRVEPFLTTRPRDYEAPPFQPSGHLWELDPGYYVLTVEPELKGIIELTIERKNLFFAPDEAAVDSVAGATRYEQITLASGYAYTLYTNQQPGVKVGVVLRKLPVDLDQPLPVSQRAGETVTVPIRLHEPGQVRAVTVAGESLELRAAGGAWRQGLDLAVGTHRVVVRNPGTDTIDYALQLSPQRLAVALPPLPKGARRALPDFPVLSAAEPRYLDLDREQRATFRVKVDQPALYRLESSGLLDIEGNLRTRINPELMRRRANGVGRNFLIQQYLREGDYQLTAQTRGQSRGHLGVRLARAPLADGGVLRAGVAARASLHAGRGLAYTFRVPEQGQYRIRAIGVGHTYRMRLEDDGGWPVITPDVPADRLLTLQAGTYRIIVPPEAVDGRVVTRVERVAEAARFEGHGPHPLHLDEAVEHVWLEPEGEAERTPDRWEVEIPAPIDATITATGEMQGRMVRLGPEDELAEVAKIAPRRGWQGELAPGRYAILLANSRRNNQVTYTLKVAARQLTVRGTRQVNTPTDLPVAVGRAGLVELSAHGRLDVRGRLYDAQGGLLAHNDDAPDDWNFLIARRLAAGQYRLRIESLSGVGATTVAMRVPEEQAEGVLQLPGTRRIADEGLHTFPVEVPGEPSMLLVAADSEDTAGVSVEAKRGADWQVVATTLGRAPRLLVPLSSASGEGLRLRVWSVGRRGAPIQLRADAYSPPSHSETELARKGVVLTAPGLGDMGLGIASVKLARPGVLRLHDGARVLWSSQPGQALRPARNRLLVADSDRLWLAAPLPAGEQGLPLRAERVYLSGDGGRSLQLSASAGGLTHVDLKAPGKGLLLAVAESRVGQPGLEIARAAPAAGAPSPARLGVAPDSVVSVMLEPDAPVARVWNAGERSQSLALTVRAYRLDPPATHRLGPGITQGELEARQARQFTLGRGPKRMELVLPAHCAAVFSQGAAITSTHWSGAAAMSETVETEAGRLTLLHLGEQPQGFRLELAEGAAGARAALLPGALFQRHLASSGVFRVPLRVGGGQRYTLRVRGPVQATLVTDNGQIRRGHELPLGGGGTLLLAHEPGLALAWLEAAEGTGMGAWAAGPAGPRRVAPPATLALDGPTQRLQIGMDQAALLHVRSDTPTVTRVLSPRLAHRVDAHPQGTLLDVYVPKGTTGLAFHPVGAERLSGSVRLSLTPAVAIGEGLGPRSLLGAGAARLFRFTVKRAGPVGIGVQASSDVVTSVLMDADGRVLGEGVVQMPTLDPGEYMLAVRVPPDSPPVRIRPVVAGTEPPDTGPPMDVVRRYLEQAGLKTEGTESR